MKKIVTAYCFYFLSCIKLDCLVLVMVVILLPNINLLSLIQTRFQSICLNLKNKWACISLQVFRLFRWMIGTTFSLLSFASGGVKQIENLMRRGWIIFFQTHMV